MKKLSCILLLISGMFEAYSQTVPVLTTNAATDVYITSAKLNGNISSNGGSILTSPTKGFVYSSTNSNPTIGGAGVTQKNLSGTTIGNITSIVTTSVQPGTLYYYQAFAHNAIGYAYGGVLTFTTGTQASQIGFSNVNSTSLTLSWTRGSFDGCIVVMSESVISTMPVDGYEYFADPAFGNGEDLGASEFVVYNGTGTTVDISGLTSGTTYYVRIFEYDSNIKYLTNTATNNPNSATTDGPPSVQSTNILFSNITSISMTASYTRGNGEYVLILAKNGSITTDPANTVVYSGNTIFGNGDVIDGAYVVYVGTQASINITGLTSGTNYTFKAYEFNDAGSPIYNVGSDTGNPNSQSTSSAVVPTLTTSSAYSITQTGAGLGGNISSNGGASLTARGVCYSITSVNANPEIGGTGVTNEIEGGTTTGSFSELISGLSAGTQYSFKAYATNSAGTAYGTALTFTTSSVTTPTLTTSAAYSISQTGAGLGGNISNDGGASITVRGVCYSITSVNANPEIGGTGVTNETEGGTTTGSFSELISGLSAGTQYSFKAYATNSAGTSYGTALTFTTNAVSAPSVTTNAATSINQTGASLGGNVTSDGGSTVTERGICYSLGSVNSNPQIGGTGVVKVIDGSGTGSFTEAITGLKFGETYYFRAYAINSVNTSYGSVLNFTTTNITQASSITIGTVTGTSIAISWTGGDGSQSLVVVHEGAGAFSNPTDGIDYSVSSVFGSGQATGSGNYTVYEGSGSSVTITNLNPSTLYSIKVFEFVGTGSGTYYQTANGSGANPNSASTNDAIWDGSSSTNWATAANWDINFVPISTTNVSIPSGPSNQPVVTADNANANNLTIEAGAHVTINNGFTLSVSGDLLLETPLNSGAAGQVVIPGTGNLSVSGTSTMERYYSNTNYWRYVSSPITSPSVMDWAGFYGNFWNASTQTWNHLTSASSIAVMQGISVVDSTSSKTLTFDGTFNNGNLSINLTNTGGGENFGWNLVGNPYPSAIDWGAGTGITRTNVAAAAYLYNSSVGSYDACTSSPCVIAAGQGFFVHTDPSGSLAFTNACRVASAQSFRKSSFMEFPKFELSAKNEYYTTKTSIKFDPNATSEYDSEYDAYKLMSVNENIADIYCLTSEGTKLVINTLNTDLLDNISEETLVIPLGITPGNNGVIEISMDFIENIDADVYIYLHDKQTNSYVDLRYEPISIQITSSTESRFELFLTKTAVSNREMKSSNPDILIYTNENKLFIKSEIFEQNNGELFLFDIMGRLIQLKHTDKSGVQEIHIEKSGTYIIKIIVNNILITQKVVVN